MKFTTTKSIVATLALCFTMGGAFAGVKDKKAKRAANEKVTKQTASTKTACGNKELKVDIVWADYDKFIADAKNAKDFADNKVQTQWIFSKAGDRAEATLKALTSLCKDKDYKEEIAKLTLIKITPQAGYKTGKTIFTKSKDSASLNVAAGHYFSRTSSDFARKIKKLY